MEILYCQRTIYPAKTAHAIHTATTAAAFAEAEINTHYFPGQAFSDRGRSLKQFFTSLGHDTLPEKLLIRAIPTRHKGLYGLGFAKLLRKTMNQVARTGQPCVCFASSVKEAVIALKARSRSRHPELSRVVFEIHHLASKLAQGKKAREIFALEERAFEECDLVVFNCEALARQAQGYLPEPRRAVSSPIGMNQRLFQPLPKPEKVNPDTVLFAYFGSLQPGKGVEKLVQSLALLPDNYRGRIIGGWPVGELEKMRSLAGELGLYGKENEQDRIEFTGQVEQRTLARHLTNVDLAVIPLEIETDFLAPMKMYESLGFALPLVATPVASLRDALTENINAVFAVSAEAVDLAAGIRRLGEDGPLRAAMRQNNARLAERFGLEQRVRALLAEFETLFLEQ